MRRPTPNHLRLIPAAPSRKTVAPDAVAVPHGGATLFHESDPRLLVTLHFDNTTEAEFLAILANLRPRFAIDLRAAPRFDLGSMNRRLVFSLLDQWGTRYVDLSSLFSTHAPRPDQLAPDGLVEALNRVVFKRATKPVGPLLFIVDAPQFAELFNRRLVDALEPFSDAGWELLRVPEFDRPETPLARRETIFISHATPEQNDFARWLGAQLSLAGYAVWFDVERLIGGETFWDEIEHTIRQRAGRVLVAVTSVAQRKPGVLDEVNLAVSVERSLGIENFVIPLRVDSIAYDQIRANLARKNIVDFSANWAAGLAKLLDALERDGFPRSNAKGLSDAAMLARQRLQSRQSTSSLPEDVLLSWVEIRALPQTVRFHTYGNIPAEMIDRVSERSPHPQVRYLRLTGGFATQLELAAAAGFDVPIADRCEVGTEEFMANGTPELPGIRPREARNHVTNLLRQAWDRKARAVGLKPFTTAANTIAWYVPSGLIPNDQVSFVDPAGVRRKKKLVGYSAKRSVFWHFALEMKPVLSSPRHFALRSHVIFSTDGAEPIANKAKMHVLRRGFCRSWWNDRWRDLTIAYLEFLADGSEEIELPVSEFEAVTISAKMMRLVSPVSVQEAQGAEMLDVELDLDIDDEEDALLDEELAEVEQEELDQLDG